MSNPPLDIQNGVFYLDGKALFLITGDYPYYRDNPTVWKDRLEKMKLGGIQVVTFYIPWRHHVVGLNAQGNQLCDFEGTTLPNRNVIQFIKLAKDIGLFVCAKPGPFIHAETDYGGLPDFVNPDNNKKIQPFRNFLAMQGKDAQSKNRWSAITGRPLPAPLDPEFLRLTKEYYELVAEKVLKGQIYPQGPIVMMQFLNEGLYSEGRFPFSNSGDYTATNITRFRKYLKEKYGTIENYNRIHDSQFTEFLQISPPGIYRTHEHYKKLEQMQKVIDWNDFSVHYYSVWVNELKSAVFQGLQTQNIPPLVSNWNPPGDFGLGLDVWASRVNVEKMFEECGVHYGYTNWIGAVNYKRSAYLRYSMLCKRANGINMEENWGFGKLYDNQYTYGFTPLYQTLLACAEGCTGYNVYTAVGTSGWDKNMDSIHEKPYPSNSPIDEKGNCNQKFNLMAGVNKFFGEYFGQEFLECSQDVMLSFGLYQPYVDLAAFAGWDAMVWKRMGLKNGPMVGLDCLGQLQVACRRLKISFQILNLETQSLERACYTCADNRGINFPHLIIFPTMRFLGRKVQENLKNYVVQGGTLVIFGEIPQLDENFQPCNILADIIQNGKSKQMKEIKHGAGILIYQQGNPFMRSLKPGYYLTFALVRLLQHIRLKIPKSGLIEGQALPFTEAFGIVGPLLFERFGGDIYDATLHQTALRSVTKLARLLQCRGIHRQIEVQVRTEFGKRKTVDAYVYNHPTKDVQYIFIFSLQSPEILPVAVQYYIPEKNRRTRVNTFLVGHTAQVIRIQDGQLDSFVYTGVNPVSRKGSALSIKINNTHIRTDTPVDVILLTNGGHQELYIANGKKGQENYLHGIGKEPIRLSNGHIKL